MLHTNSRRMSAVLAAVSLALPPATPFAQTVHQAHLKSGTVFVDERGTPGEMHLLIELRLAGLPVVSKVRLHCRSASGDDWMDMELARDGQGLYPMACPYAPSLEYYFVVVTEKGDELPLCSRAKPCVWDTSALPRVRPGSQGKGRGRGRTMKAAGAGVAAAVLAFLTGGTVGGPGTPADRTVELPSSDVPKPIPDLGAAVSELGVAQSGTISEAFVSFRIGHHCRGDLRLYVRHPDGTSYAFDAPKDCGEVWEEQLPVSAANKPAAGTWTLTVIDQKPEDVGVLEAWGLRLRLRG